MYFTFIFLTIIFYANITTAAEYECEPSELLIISNFTHVDSPFKTNNYYLSTNVDFTSIMIRVYPLPVEPHNQRIRVYVSHEFCPLDRESSEYYIETTGMSFATIYIDDAEVGDYVSFVDTEGPYSLQACGNENCSSHCGGGCYGNGYCNVLSSKCVCSEKWGGVNCEVFCEDTDDCDSHKPNNGDIFPFFGSMPITVLLIGVLPCLVATGITTAVISYCKKSTANSKKEHTQPITIYQSFPYEKVPKSPPTTVAVFA